VKSILQVLSIFNFNIDIAAPECLVPDFDFKLKWIITMLLPLIFMGLLFMIFLVVLMWKFCKKMMGIGGKAPKYCSHANKQRLIYLHVNNI
jgi:hypothetical protein